MPTATSELTGESVDTTSDAWRHECECVWLLTNKPTRFEKHIYLYGVADRSQLFRFDTKTGKEVLSDDYANRPRSLPASIFRNRGLEAADRILADARRIHEARKARSA